MMLLQSTLRRESILAFGLLTLAGCCHPQVTPVDRASAVRTAVPRPEIVSAAAWGSTPTTMPESDRHTVRYLTIHHAGELWKAGSDPVMKLRNLQKYGQKDKNWPDLPYHFLITPDGTIYEGRSLEFKPATNTTYVTDGHVGVMLYGNFEVQRVSEAQLVSTVKLSAWICDQFHLSPADIRGHKDRAETDCPGVDFYRYIEDGTIGRWVEQQMAGNTPTVTSKPELPNGPTTMISQ